MSPTYSKGVETTPISLITLELLSSLILGTRQSSYVPKVRLSQYAIASLHKITTRITSYNVCYTKLLRGTHVVMDFPANTTKQRAWFKELCEEAACEHALIFLDVSDERCLTQIARRRTEQPERAPFDTEAMFNHVTKFFEPPLEDEGFNIIRMSN